MSDLIKFTFRKAILSDATELEKLIIKSSKEINSAYYSDKEIAAAIGIAWTVDEQLIQDETYWVAENLNGKIIGCGGWSKRKTLFGKQEITTTKNSELLPGVDSAKIRAFFVDPDYVRNGIGSKLLEICESKAKKAGYNSLELIASLSGEKLYKTKGFIEIKRERIETEKGIFSQTVTMYKSLK